MNRSSKIAVVARRLIEHRSNAVTQFTLAACVAIASAGVCIQSAMAEYPATGRQLQSALAHSDVPDLPQRLDLNGESLAPESSDLALAQPMVHERAESSELLGNPTRTTRTALSLSYRCTFIAGYDAGPGAQEDIEVQGELPLRRCGTTGQGPLYKLSASCDEDDAPQQTVYRFADGRQLSFFLYGIVLDDQHFSALNFMSIVQNLPQYDFVHLERAIWEIVPAGITRHQVSASGPVPMCYFSITKR